MKVVFLIVTICAVASAEKGKECRTSNGKSGTCVPLNTCQVVFNAIATKNSSAHDVAQQSSCGYDNEPLVCCESPGSVIVPNFESKALPDKAICGVVKEQSRILGGEIAELGEFPWMVIIEYKNKRTGEDKGPLCAGALINNRYVLTAANCLTSKDFDPVRVSLGEWNITTDPDCRELLANIECADPVKKVPIKDTVFHPFFSRVDGYNDIGLILLENEIQFTDFISPICLPFQNLPTPEPGSRLTAAGWGSTVDGSNSDVLLKVKLPLVSNDECNEKLKKAKKSASLQEFCAGGERNKDTCRGDAGAPFISINEDKHSGRMQWYQHGIVSRGARCGVEGYPAIYTRVSSYMDWIINVISED